MSETPLLNLDIFGPNTLPLAAYVEPDGYNRLTSYKTNRTEHYDRFVPITKGIANSLYGSIAQPNIWGNQIWKKDKTTGEEYGDWKEEHRARMYPSKGARERPGKTLTAHELLRSLSQPKVYAFGRTDQHDDELECGYFKNEQFRTTKVSVLCIDVDMDTAWRQRDDAALSAIKRELSIEHEIATMLGLPFQAFRTGRRGHQIVLPLPAPIDRIAASWLLHAYKGILTPYHYASGEAHADKDNLMNCIVRIAGGRHIATEELALWIDASNGRLYPLEQQVELMKHGYQHPPLTDDRVQEFVDAAEELSQALSSHRIPRHLSGSQVPHFGVKFWEICRELDDNVIVNRFTEASEVLSLADNDEAPKASASQRLEVALTKPKYGSDKASLIDLNDPSEDANTWANRIWNIDWAEGEFWEWIHEGGYRGITAAKILFGDEALDKLIERTHQYDNSIPRKARERRRVITELYAEHVMMGYKAGRHLAAVIGDVPEEAAELIPSILEKIGAKKKVQARNLNDLTDVVRVYLLAFHLESITAAKGYVDLSLDAIRDSVIAMNESSTIDRSTVQRLMKRIKQDEPDCGFSLIQEIKIEQGYTRVSRYRPGADLRATLWGQRLPVDNEVDDAPMRTEPLAVTVWKFGRLVQEVIPPRASRGRKKKDVVADLDDEED